MIKKITDNVEFDDKNMEGQWMPRYDIKGEEKEHHEAELTRLASNFTFSRIKNYNEINAETEIEGDKKFLEKKKEAWKDIVVHGLIVKGKDGKPTVSNFSDLDGETSVGLFKLAGLDTSRVDYVRQGDSREGKINIDTGNMWGLVVKDGGKTMFIDHHGPDAQRGTSSAELTYKILTGLGLLKQEKYLDEMVKFVTNLDNADYIKTLNKDFFKNEFGKTLPGLRKFITYDNLRAFFKMKKNPWRSLSEGDLKSLGKAKEGNKTIFEISEAQQKTARESVNNLEKIEKDGLVVESERYGKIVVDLDRAVFLGFDAAVACGYDTYIKWSQKNNHFSIYSIKEITDKFSQGTLVRGNM